MNTTTKVLLCLLIIPVFVFTDITGEITDGTGDASDSTLIGSSGSGSTGGTAGSDNLYIFYEMEKTNKLLYKITGSLSLLTIIGCMIIYSIYRTSIAINNDEKFKSDQKSFMLACMIAIVFFSIYVCVR